MIDLEKYMIPAMEAWDDEIEISDEVRKIFTKLNCFSRSDKLSYSRLSDLIEYSDNLDKLTTSDLRKIHNCFYNEKIAIDFFCPEPTPEDTAQIKKYRPVPIYANGMGDHYCLTANLEVKEYIHDAKTYFDAPYARDYKTFKEWLDKFYKKYAEK